MLLAFDKNNLDAAVARVIDLAAANDHQATFVLRASAKPTLQTIELSDPVQVRHYLKTRAHEAFEKETFADGQPVIPGLIYDVVYRTVGVVFEAHPAEGAPASEADSAGVPTHLAMFWQTL